MCLECTNCEIVGNCHNFSAAAVVIEVMCACVVAVVFADQIGIQHEADTIKSNLLST